MFDKNKIYLPHVNLLTEPYSNKKELFLFIKHPLRFFETCGKLPGKSLHLYIHLIWIHKVTKKNPVKAQSKKLKELGVSRYSFYRARNSLKKAGLIDFSNKNGCSTEITLMHFDKNK